MTTHTIDVLTKKMVFSVKISCTEANNPWFGRGAMLYVH